MPNQIPVAGHTASDLRAQSTAEIGRTFHTFFLLSSGPRRGEQDDSLGGMLAEKEHESEDVGDGFPLENSEGSGSDIETKGDRRHQQIIREPTNRIT